MSGSTAPALCHPRGVAGRRSLAAVVVQVEVLAPHYLESEAIVMHLVAAEALASRRLREEHEGAAAEFGTYPKRPEPGSRRV